MGPSNRDHVQKDHYILAKANCTQQLTNPSLEMKCSKMHTHKNYQSHQ